MKKFGLYMVVAGAVFLTACCNRHSSLESSFVNPPDDVRIGVYWYWMNDNISQEGVIKDLQAMKKAGITRAFIGNIGGQTSAPAGEIPILTDAWWEVMHTALRTATELDIELGIFNCPGWSQSGGPWIKPEQAMRYLASAERKVNGPVRFSGKLLPGVKDFQDVKTLAFKAPSPPSPNLFALPGARTVLSRNITGKKGYALPAGTESSIGLILPQAQSARSLIVASAGNIYAKCRLQVKKGSEYKTVKEFIINRTNAALHVGFDPYAPVVVSFPERKAAEFRIVFKETSRGSVVSSVTLSPVPVVERYPEKTLAKMFQSPLPYWHDYMWDAQTTDTALCINPEQVLDISANLSSDGTLAWDVPAGEWVIMRTGMTPTGVTNGPASPQGTGLEVDKMSKEHVAAHFDAFLGELLRRIPAADRKSFKIIVEDSYETGGQNFTDGLIEAFTERYGYDPVPYLPALKGYTVGSPDRSDRFLWDLRRLIADKVSYDYVGGLREVGHRNGLTTWLENYGHWGFPGEFLQYGGQSDEVGGEFWAEGDLGSIECRAASSCAHIYGKPQVSAESFTAGGNAFARYPATLKRRGDWSFTEGINKTLMHVYIQQPYEDIYPGIDAWFGTEFNRKNTWFEQIDLFTLYLRRCNFMLQQGLNVADAAYYIGDDAPKMTGVRAPEIPAGYSFDYINGEVIERDLSVKDGRLTLPHGTSYRLLVLPPQATMRPEVLRKIEQLIVGGAVVLGSPPTRAPGLQNYPEADNEVRTLAENIWGKEKEKQRHFGKGMVLTDMTIEEVFDLLHLPPDCKIAGDAPALYVHRTLGDGEIYFISNQSQQTIRLHPQFRVAGLQPELWDAASGSVRALPAFEQHGSITAVPLQLEAGESAFVVFRKQGKPSASGVEANFPQPAIVADITAPWEVQFEADAVKRGPSGTVLFDKLSDWSEHADERIRYYSGKAVYKTTVTLADKPGGERLFIDLGAVAAMAKVRINGEYAGGAWTPPYRIDITRYAKKGDNIVEIEVVNTWVNRLVGDAALPEAQRRVKTFSSAWTPDAPLQPAGLLGPVNILGIKY
jgi:hypothetical protein